jgi:ubiquinol-cytochrome c reductase cytochrome c subunit
MKRLLVPLLLLLFVPDAPAATPPGGVVANVAQGTSLYAANCSRCHGSHGQGIRDQGPSLKGVGALGADFYVRTGYMPLNDPHAQPWRTRVLFTEQEIRSLVAYVATIARGPPIPSPQWQSASVPAGRDLFADHCAGCHQIAIAGGVLPGARIPSLNQATPRQIAEAVRVGPYLMPKFSRTAITPTQLNDIVAYVQYAKHPEDRGGWAIGHLGPWPEGIVTWLVASTVLVATCLVIGRRFRKA